MLFVLLIFTLVGCSQSTNTTSQKHPYSPKGVLGINQRINIDYVQHLEGDEYEIGVINEKTKQLVWKDNNELITDWGFPDLQVYIEDNIEKSYLERKPDEKNGTPLFVLHIAKTQEISGGTITRTCGKGCTREINSTMIK